MCSILRIKFLLICEWFKKDLLQSESALTHEEQHYNYHWFIYLLSMKSAFIYVHCQLGFCFTDLIRKGADGGKGSGTVLKRHCRLAHFRDIISPNATKYEQNGSSCLEILCAGLQGRKWITVHQTWFLDRRSKNQNCYSCGIFTLFAIILSLVNISLFSSLLAILLPISLWG